MRIYPAAIFLLVIIIMATVQFAPPAYAANPPPIKWNKVYGKNRPEMAYATQQTSDNGYIVTGYTSSSGAGNADFWLVKADSKGTMQWNRTYGGTNQDKAYAAQQTSDSGYVLAGSTHSFGVGFSDFWVVKTGPNGEMSWSKTYGGTSMDIANFIQQTSDGGFVVAGSTNSFGFGYEDFWLVKTDANGAMQWNKTYGGIYDEIAYCVQKTNDGGYAVCGYTGSFGNGYEDFYLVKTDANGNKIWHKTYGGDSSEYAYFLKQTTDNGYILAGSTYTLDGDFDMWLVKTDSAGNMQWNKTYGGLLDEEAYAVWQAIDGGYIIAGFTDSYGSSRDIWVIKTDSGGNAEWSQTYGGTEKDEAYAVQQTRDGGYVIAATTYSFGQSWDPNFYLLRLAGPVDVTIQNMVSSKNIVSRGYAVSIDVYVKNWGVSTVTFNLTLYADTIMIASGNVLLTGGNSKVVTFTWNTVGFKGSYLVNAYAWPVPGEIDVDDNRADCGLILVTCVGDVNGDRQTDLTDIMMVIDHVWTMPESWNWNGNMDIDNNFLVDLVDVMIAIYHFLEVDT